MTYLTLRCRALSYAVCPPCAVLLSLLTSCRAVLCCLLTSNCPVLCYIFCAVLSAHLVLCCLLTLCGAVCSPCAVLSAHLVLCCPVLSAHPVLPYLPVRNGEHQGFSVQYEGHRNSDTIKQVNFLGSQSEMVCSI